MLNKACYVVLLCTLFITIQAQPSSVNPKVEVEATHSNSNLVLLRTTGIYGSAIALKTFAEDEMLSKLNNNRFAKQELSNGDHTIKYQWYGKKVKKKAKTIDINLQSDETTYVLFFLEAGFFRNKTHAVEITEESAAKYINDFKQDFK